MDESPSIYEFGPFRLDPRKRVLSRDGLPIALTPKPLELLVVLVERAGRVVDKEQLMRRLWPDSFVEEGNLAVNVSILRKALGESPSQHEYIRTVPGVGYEFVARVTAAGADFDAGLAAPPRPVASTGRNSVVLAAAAVALVVAVAVGFPARRGGDAPEPTGAGPAARFSSVEVAGLTHTGEAGLAAISPDGKYVVHVAVEGGRQGLQVRQLLAPSGVQVVPPAEVRYDGLTFSPDGQSIFYSRVEGQARSAALFRVPMLGGAPAQVIDDVDTSVSFSPDASRFVFVRGYPQARETCLVVAGADGSRERRLACRAQPDPYGLSGIAWSPDGRTIAVPVVAMAAPGRDRVVLVDSSSGAERPFGDQSFQRIGFLGWLPDQGGLVVDAAPAGQGRGRSAGGQLWLLPFPAGGARRLTNDLSDYYGVSVARAADSLVSLQRDPRSTLWIADGGDAPKGRAISSAVTARDGEGGIAWTPDGRLLFASLAGGSWDIWTSDAGGTQRRQLTSDPAAETLPTVSPDGRIVLFLSDQAGSSDLWRMDADGADLQRLTRGAAVVRAAFLPGGGEIVYSSGAPPRTWKIPAAGGTPVPILRGDELPPAFQFHAVSADGRSLLGSFPQVAARGWRVAAVPIDGRGRWRDLGAILDPEAWTADVAGIHYPVTERGTTNIWRLPLQGGPPVQVTRFDRDRIFQFAWSRDGRSLAMTRGAMSANVVLLTGR